MTDKDKIIKELKEALDSLDITNKYRLNLIRAIEYLQEEPVSEDLEEASKEWLRPQLDKSYTAYGETKQMELTHFDGYAMLDAIEFGAKWGKNQAKVEIQAQSMALAHGCPKEPVSEDWEEAMQYNAPNNIGIDDLLYWRNGFITGAKWQKEQIIKDAVEAKVYNKAYPTEFEIQTNTFMQKLKHGDKVKMILIKED